MHPSQTACEFQVDGRLVTVAPAGRGNVNDTYLVVMRTTFSEQRFILQRLNLHVFTSPEAVMHNMKMVTEHVHQRLEEEADTADRIWQLPRVIPTTAGHDYLIDEDDQCWRAISLIASATAYDKIQSPEHAYEAGYVLGQFQRLISDVPVSELKDTLPGFHITPRYLEMLDTAIATKQGHTRAHSSKAAQQCLRFVEERRELCSLLEDAKACGDLQLRPVHGDPKVANIMIDNATAKGTCMIDLDTVKPGLIHYDIGDCLRSCCNMASEETLDLGTVVFDTDLCELIIRGYMKFARTFLTEADHHYMYDCIRLLTFELGLRFFVDFVSGDRYFKVQSEGQNLNRASVQFRLCASIEAREGSIRRILDSHN